jgi:hypothetical protein
MEYRQLLAFEVVVKQGIEPEELQYMESLLLIDLEAHRLPSRTIGIQLT